MERKRCSPICWLLPSSSGHGLGRERQAAADLVSSYRVKEERESPIYWLLRNSSNGNGLCSEIQEAAGLVSGYKVQEVSHWLAAVKQQQQEWFV